MATPHLDYGRPNSSRASRSFTLAANLLLVYPILVLASLYGEWLLAWIMLGHQPQPSVDDPKDIAVASWIHPFVALAFVALVPVLIAAFVSNFVLVMDKRLTQRQIALRLMCFVTFWLGVLAFMRYDPNSVVNWWFD